MRLFAAIELPERARRAVDNAMAAARRELPAAAWVRVANLHVTLVFFGEVPDARVSELADLLAAAARESDGLRLRLAGAGGFPPRGRIRIVWLGIEPHEPLRALADRLRRAARAEAIPFDDKPFRGHLTLARCRRAWPAALRERLATILAVEPVEMVVRDAVLLASQLAPGGSRYCEVARLALGEAA